MSLLKIKYTELDDNLVITIVDCNQSVLDYLRRNSYFGHRIENINWTIRLNQTIFIQPAMTNEYGEFSQHPILYLSKDSRFNSVLVNCIGEFTKERYIECLNETLGQLIKTIENR